MKSGWQSQAQREFGHSKEGVKQLGKELISELDKLTGKRRLPKRVKKK